jgi:hypothetical protein
MGAEDEAYVVIRVLVPRLSNSTCPPPSKSSVRLSSSPPETSQKNLTSAPDVTIYAQLDRHTENGQDDGPPSTRAVYIHVILGDFDIDNACLDLSGRGCRGVLSFVHGSHLTASVT